MTATLANCPDPKAHKLYREACQDEDGQHYTVIVWRAHPSGSGTLYTLDDGSPVTFEDDCWFTVVETGMQLTRCED